MPRHNTKTSRWKRLHDRDDRAFVLVLLAMIMTVLFLMAGFAVDLGYWYMRSAQIQRASDAAALAGSIDMPNASLATSDALASAAKNGFVNGQNGVGVKVTTLNAGEINVSITDPKVATFFTSMIMSHISITRDSSAAQLSSVPMGTPYNVLGSGDQSIGGFPVQDFWLSINGYCTPKEDGDLYNAGFDGNRIFMNNGVQTTTPATQYRYKTLCDGTGGVNTDYKASGYDYTITVPPNSPGSVEVDVFDPEYNPYGASNIDWQAAFPHDVGYTTDPSDEPSLPNGPPALTTNFTLYDTNNSESTADDVQVSPTKSYGYIDNRANIANTWVKIGSLPANNTSQPHKYRLNVSEPTGEQGSYGINSFSIRALRSWSSTQYCDVRQTADCPQVSGDGAMSVMADIAPSNGYDTFWLANVDPSYTSDTLTVNLWDPGEGFKALRLIAPDGSVVPVRWSVSPTIASASNNETYAVDTSNNDPTCSPASWDDDTMACPQPGPNRNDVDKLNDRMLTITAKIPDDYASYISRASGSTWWSVQYQLNDNSPPGEILHDRTTWQVQIGGGEPAHLVP